MVVEAILYLWIILFVVLMLWFFIFQPKLGLYYKTVKNKNGELIDTCRPGFFLAKYSEQLVFLIFMFNHCCPTVKEIKRA